jgi:hypothetical protein
MTDGFTYRNYLQQFQQRSSTAHRIAHTCGALSLIATFLLPVRSFGQKPVQMNEILARPTDHSVQISALFDRQVEVYFQYGDAPGVYALTTPTRTSADDEPVEAVFDDLQPDTRYYYRTCYKTVAGTSFTIGAEHTFHTQRRPGSTFSFTIEADPHPYDKKGCATLWNIALDNQRRDSADFLLDLGDTFGDDHEPFTITDAELRQLHLDCRPFFGRVCHSSPLFFCLGNHEGESGYYLLQTPPDNIAVRGTRWRQYYYPNPVPDGFYTGNTVSEDFGIGLPENYYAWEWGDALFVVLDAYRGYTANAKPRKWEWTLGREQYDWFARTLANSRARFKFVFNHHTLGESRGGAATAKLYECGGYDGNGTSYDFDANRPGWGLPIHQLMKQHGVTIYFQGHDHLYAKEDVEGIVYQEVPMPSDSTYIIGTRDNGDAYTGVIMDASGHLRVTVSPAQVTVDYVRAWLPADETNGHVNGEVAYSYSVDAGATSAPAPPMPSACSLEQNHPNPFAASTTIRYHLSHAGPVSLTVCDVLGRQVRTLVQDWQSAGTHGARMLAEDLPAGVYMYRLQTPDGLLTRKAVLTH